MTAEGYFNGAAFKNAVLRRRLAAPLSQFFDRDGAAKCSALFMTVHAAMWQVIAQLLQFFGGQHCRQLGLGASA